MFDTLIDAFIDSLKIFPFLFIVYLIMEFIEHKSSNKMEKIVKNNKYGPVIGGVLGAIPQCGFSVMASNLYVSGLITMGTLISIFLSTSDEMLPIFLSSGFGLSLIIKIIMIKVVIGIIFGIIIDLFFKKSKTQVKKNINSICNEEECHCDENILLSSLKHSISIFIFILIVNIFMSVLIDIIGQENISNLFVKNSIIGPIVCSLIGLIPNCASSVIITKLFMQNVITFGTMLSGLLCASGLGMLVLFRVGKKLKDNFKILTITFLSSVFIGIIFNILKIII